MDRIDALRLLGLIAQHGSFSAAARQANIKQSTASKWVAELEAMFQTTLVRRTTRSVHLTNEGTHLLARAREVITAFDGMTQAFEAQSPEPAGRIRISAPVVFGRLFVVPIIADFVEKHRQVEVEMVLGDRYVNLVEEGFDLAVRVGVPTDTSALGRKLASSRRILVASPAYIAAQGCPRVPKDLTKHACLVHGDANTGAIWRFGRKRGAEVPVSIRGRIAVNNSEAVLLLARRGLGIALLADWLVQDDLKRKTLVPLLGNFTAPPAPIYAIMPPGRFGSMAVRALVDHLAEALSP